MDLKPFIMNSDEKPLDNIVTDGGMCGIFRCMGFIGDSLSSGEFEIVEEGKDKIYLDCFQYSWGQYIGRAAGLKARNFSRGGMTASEYWNSFADANDFWNEDLICQAYVIALGVNDVVNAGQEAGSASDINEDDYNLNRETFAGYYARIIQRLKKMNPDAKFFLVTLPRERRNRERAEKASAAIRELAEYFDNTYLIDLEKYAPEYDEEFRRNFFLEGHMNPAGYLLTGKMIASYIDWIIRNNPEDFYKVGLIPYKE